MKNANRCFNVLLKEFFEPGSFKKPNKLSNQILDALRCQQIVNRLDLTSKYKKGNVDIVDIFPGYGLLSSMINKELQPRKHLLVEHRLDFYKRWEKMIQKLNQEGEQGNYILSKLDGYSWRTYPELVGPNKLLDPAFKDRSEPHDELLILANATDNESLLAQWLMCAPYENWLQKYGRVRLISLAGSATAAKFTQLPKMRMRSRTGMKARLFHDISLVAASTDNVGFAGIRYDPRVLIKDQPIQLDPADLSKGGNCAIVEATPRHIKDVDVDEMDYLTLLFRRKIAGTAHNALDLIYTGAGEELAKRLEKGLLDKRVIDLTDEDMLKIYHAYHFWPFKPSIEETHVFEMDESAV